MQIVKSLLLGIMTALTALIIEALLFSFLPEQAQIDYQQKFTFYLIIVVLIEELLKFFAIRKGLFQEKNIFYSSLFVGLSFALTEILLNGSSSALEAMYFLGIFGMLFIHMLTAGIFGLTLKPKKNTSFVAKIILLAFLIHLSYNLLVIHYF